MPPDRHDLFAGMSEEELRKLLPAATVEEYLRHGKPATPDDDEYQRAGFNELGQRVALDDPKKTEERFDRPLRDYSYLFDELTRQRTLLSTEKAGLTLDNNRLKAAQENALQLTAHREQELAALEKDSEMMQRDRQTIEKLRDTIASHVERARQMAAELIPANAELATELIRRQTTYLRELVAPAAAGLTGAP
jgi:hypothetical protein